MTLIGLFPFILHLIILISDCAMCWNSTNKYLSMEEGEARTRHSRLFSFNTFDDEIKLDLDFTVPFIKIPVKKPMDGTKGPIADINLGAVVTAGVITVAAGVAVPALLSILGSKSMAPLGEGNSYSPYRTLPIQRDSPSDMWRYLEILDNALMEINIDTTSCLQRSLCSTVRASSKNVNDGNGSSMDKIIDGLASNEWLQRFMSETPFYAAMKSGLRDSDCGREYDKCTVSKGALNMILKKLAGLVHGQGQNKDMFS